MIEKPNHIGVSAGTANNAGYYVITAEYSDGYEVLRAFVASPTPKPRCRESSALISRTNANDLRRMEDRDSRRRIRAQERASIPVPRMQRSLGGGHLGHCVNCDAKLSNERDPDDARDERMDREMDR